MTEQLPEPVLRLLLDRVQTIDRLQVLLLLLDDSCRGVRVDTTSDSVAERLKLAPQTVSAALEALEAHQLARHERISPLMPAAWRYAPGDPALAPVVKELARLHAEQPMVTLKILATHSIERIRGAALRAFADAFDLGKREK